MSNITRLLAWRYLWGSRHEKNISTMIALSFIGIFIGAFSLALVMAIMNGFDHTIHKKIQGIHADIIVETSGYDVNMPALTTILHNNFPEIIAFSPNSVAHALVHNDAEDETPTLALIKAIDPQQEIHVTALEQKIITPHGGSLAHILNNNHVLIGATLAESLQATIGDTITLLHSEGNNTPSRTITLARTNVVVGGIVKTGIDEFDGSLIICSLNFLNTLFPENGITHIIMKLSPTSDEKQVVQKLTETLHLETYTWKDLYPALMSAQILEKYAMFFILALITLVASMSIISLLFMLITQKRAHIAILRALGAAPHTIVHIFMYIGFTIAGTASFLGITCACIASYALERYPFITLPDAYFASHLPAHMEWYIIALVACVVMAMSCIAIWIPTRKTHTINISHVLRFEG